jgi:hypothetical protein
MRVQLHPNFLRGAAWVLSWLVAAVVVTYFWKGHHWTIGYAVSLLIPITIFISFVCFMSVPSRLEFSDTHFLIQFLFRRVHKIPWDELEYYGWLEGVYGLQFRSAGVFGFLPQALSRDEWKIV